ncbi:hypothetical protein K0T92_10980 [Paenibacillus oenotherae]|uniref:Uncharacterized protein n=1 Tax=Paenibacillus oenotherae TaxID=1435645 RepID=A0ABS7D610_9BACL|nr:hypothetical protein [Paenibacillus oenotherae]MBW7475271.1 hypothetical protein [Paenibacillus oenotherae]
MKHKARLQEKIHTLFATIEEAQKDEDAEQGDFVGSRFFYFDFRLRIRIREWILK